MSSIAVEMGPSQHPAVLQHTDITPSRLVRSSEVAPSISLKDENPMDDIIGSAEVQPTTSNDKDQKKKTGAGFNLKKTAKNVVSGMKRKKKGLGEDERSKSHEDLSTDIGDQANASKGKVKNITFNKMLNTFSNPSQKFNKMWSSLNKTFSNTSNQAHQFNELSETRSTMTLGRFFGKKREGIELPPMKEERKAQTLGRMFHFKSPSKKQNRSDAGGSAEKDSNLDD